MQLSPNTKKAVFVATSLYAAGSLVSSTVDSLFPRARAQSSFPTTAVTGGEIIQNMANPTDGFFTIPQLSTFQRIIAGHVSVTGSVTIVATCGAGPSIAGTDVAGQVTFGTGSPTTCSISFASAYAKAPFCSVDWATNLAVMNANVTTNSILLTQTSNSSSVVSYICIGQAGG